MTEYYTMIEDEVVRKIAENEAAALSDDDTQDTTNNNETLNNKTTNDGSVNDGSVNDETVNDDNVNDETRNSEDQERTKSNMSDKKRVSLYEKWITFFVNDGIILQDDQLVCTICCKQISADKKSRLSEHVNSKKHKKFVETPQDERPTEFVAYTPSAAKKAKLGHSTLRTYSRIPSENGRDKSHEILLADTLNLFVQLDVPFDKLNSEVWQAFVKKHVKNGELILKNFTFYKTSS